eukprot:TRINITY_DN33033_c0_g1_i1.p1 TRINITY_DN33033_c0_g1~~TRINITY_DN33033_c0_g1_i1.p1  ORF type:complete len:370 (+),score=65.39 TRINITY_DN33033_c0_g1_i1:50-1159(+)
MNGGATGTDRPMLTGTFLAEQTHTHPLKYTLISVSSSLGPDGSPQHRPSRGFTADATKPSSSRWRGGNGATPVTELPALMDMEPLLTVEEGKKKQVEGETHAEGETATGELRKEDASSAATPRARPKAKQRGRPGSLRDKKGRRSPRELATSTIIAEVFARLQKVPGERQPWAATKTNSELLTYLAQRSNDPELAKMPEAAATLKASAALPGSRVSQLSPQSSTRRSRKHDTHTELFDSCLRHDHPRPPSPTQMWDALRAASCSPRRQTAWASRPGSRVAGGSEMLSTQLPSTQFVSTQASLTSASRMTDLIEDIMVLPLDPVEAFFEADRAAQAAKLAKKAKAEADAQAAGAGSATKMGVRQPGRSSH